MWIARRKEEEIMRGRPPTHQLRLGAIVNHHIRSPVASAAAPSATRIPSIAWAMSPRRLRRQPRSCASLQRHRSRLNLLAWGDPTDARNASAGKTRAEPPGRRAAPRRISCLRRTGSHKLSSWRRLLPGRGLNPNYPGRDYPRGPAQPYWSGIAEGAYVLSP
jgi:hypothetical protein